jgi:hypothetical protein
MYDFCEAMVPNGPYLELWARVNNQREGWISVGNESIAYLDKQINYRSTLEAKRKPIAKFRRITAISLFMINLWSRPINTKIGTTLELLILRVDLSLQTRKNGIDS